MSGRTQAPILRTNNFRKRANKLHSSSPEQNDAPKERSIIIKKELPDDEFKEYAATTMSEFLSWYGYDKVDSGCTRGLNLDHFTSSMHHNNHILGRNLSRKVAVSRSPLSTNLSTSPFSRSSKSPPPASNAVHSSKDTTRMFKETTMSPLSLKTGPASPRLQDNSDSTSESPDSPITCSWCGEPGSSHVSCGIANGSEQFCSEACFAAGRRAAFKRARICDWCRHVRHSISYVDFQDGESQLQFCSDKCLNQYKMNIFCRETQAHLALHNPNSSATNLTGGNLITPELWLRDCRSAPPSPIEEMLVVDDEPMTMSALRQDKSFQQTESSSSQKTNPKANEKTNKTRNTVNGKIRHKSSNRKKESNSETDIEEEPLKLNLESNHKDVSYDMSSLETCIDRTSSRQNMSSSQRKDDSLCGDSNSSRESIRGSPDNNNYRKQPLELSTKESTKSRRSQRHSRSQRLFQNAWMAENSPQALTPMMSSTPRAAFAPSTPFKFPPHPAMFPNSTYRSAVQAPHIPQLPPTSAAPTLVPPVTVLVPYPIPIPIPLPIPIPIPLFGCLPTEKKNKDVTKDVEDNFVAIPEDLSKHGVSDKDKEETKRENNSVDEENIAEDKAEDEAEASAICLSKNSTPFRKKRRLIEATEEKDNPIKQRNKFVPV